MDHSLTPEEQNTLIEDALHTYPLAPMPRTVTEEVMARVQTSPTPRPFRLAWNDLIVAVVLSMCLGAVWFSIDHLPPLIVAQLRKESILLYQHLLVNLPRGLPLVAFGLAAFLAALAIPFLRRELMK